MHKFFIQENQIKNDKIIIEGTDVNHIANVLRLKKEELIQVCNIQSPQNYITSIQEINKEKVVVKIIKEINSKVESNVELHIYQGLPKADKMELIIQKTTEVGVYTIIPVSMERSIVKIDGKDEKKKIDRWQKIAEVAAKQSKRDIIPKIENIQTVQEICNKIQEYDCFIVAYEEEKENKLKKILQSIDKKQKLKIGVLIGPEGGIDEKEINKLKESKAKIVTLGNRILRTETAPISMASIILYELENE